VFTKPETSRFSPDGKKLAFDLDDGKRHDLDASELLN